MKRIILQNISMTEISPKKKMKYLIASSFLFFSQYSIAEPYKDFSEASGTYIGLCYGMEYLKLKKCPQISIVTPNSCIDNVTKLVPSTNSIQFARALLQIKEQLKSNAINGIEVGFAKTLALAKGDLDKACFGYGSSLATMSHMKHEEVKRLSKSLN